MNLTENKIYMSDELCSEVHIAEGASVMIFDEANILEKVTFGEWSSLKYFWYFEKEKVFDKHFLINGENSKCEVNCLLSSLWEKITAKIDGELAASGSYLNMNIVSFVWDTGIIDLDGIVNIIEGVEKVEWYLVEENIFLGQSGKVRGLPTLLVHSNDVKASHACNMQRISDEKLFYLRSRGLPKEDATVMMLESYIAKIFWELGHTDSELCRSIKYRILERIKSK
jgi:Fe-S cluster assembly scaffold protein SufB